MGTWEKTLILDRSFYLEDNVVDLAKKLLGKWLMTEINGIQTGGMIIETEAYRGPDDKACHAYQNRRTKRTEVMFQKGGVAYVYLCYGMHHLFNVVTNREDIPHAILIRSLLATDGVKKMQTRRKNASNLTSGPGVVCKALGIDQSFNGCTLDSRSLWIEDRGVAIKQSDIHTKKRVGIDYAGDDAQRPWRFLVAKDL